MTWRHMGGDIRCRVCNTLLDAATDAFNAWTNKPRNDDFSVCAGCGEISCFVVGPLGVSLREPTVQELKMVARDARFHILRRLIDDDVLNRRHRG